MSEFTRLKTNDRILRYRENPITLSTYSSRVKIIKELGKGSFGVTYLAQDTYTGLPMAIKFGKYTDLREPLVGSFLWNNINPIYQKHIPEVYGYFRNKDQLIILQELMSGISLSDAIKKNTMFLDKAFFKMIYNYRTGSKIGVLEDKFIYLVIKQLTELTNAILATGRGISHNDLTLNNILWDEENKRIYLIDMGIACIINGERDFSCSDGVVLHYGYSHPELFAKRRELFTHQNMRNASYWQVGVVFLNLLFANWDEKTLVTPLRYPNGERFQYRGANIDRDWQANLINIANEFLSKHPGTLFPSKEYAYLEFLSINYFRAFKVPINPDSLLK